MSLSWEDFALFNREMAGAVEAGVPLSGEIGRVGRELRRRGTREALETVRKEVEGGASLHEALEKRKSDFSPAYIAMVQAGIEGGNLSDVLRHVAEEAEFTGRMRGEILRGAFYPAFIVLASLFFVTLFNNILADTLLETFQGINVQFIDPKTGKSPWNLPTAWHVFAWLGDHVTLLWAILGGAGGLYIAFILLSKRISLLNRFRWTLRMMLPFVWRPMRAGLLARFLFLLRGMVAAGLPLPRALDLVRGTLEGTPVEKPVAELAGKCNEGGLLSEGMVGMPIFSTSMIWALKAGESSGNLPETLASLAGIQRERWERGMAFLKTVILPAFLVCAGLILLLAILTLVISYVRLLSIVQWTYYL
ncbi:MAG: type II secretion system F family protein [Planctomycetota bacterium]|jgi:type II secretory pathway component PulF